MATAAPRALILLMDDPDPHRPQESMRWPLYDAHSGARDRGHTALRLHVPQIAPQDDRHSFCESAGMLLDTTADRDDLDAQQAALRAALDVLAAHYGGRAVVRAATAMYAGEEAG